MKMIAFLRAVPYVDFNMKDADWETPLFGAIDHSDLDLVKYLVEQCGCKVDHQEIQGRTPLYYAASKGEIAIVKYFIGLGASINVLTRLGRSALLKAVWNGETEMVRELLRDPNVDMAQADAQGRTALHMAAWGKYGGRLRVKASKHADDCPEIVEMLLALGADPNVKDVSGKCALDIACSSGGSRCIKMLVEAGADVNNSDPDGVTPLHEAFYRGNRDSLYELIKFRPNTGAKTRTGKIPMDCLFIDNMHPILDYVLNDPEFLALDLQDPNLTVSSSNIERLLSHAIMYKAEDCYNILLDYQARHQIQIDSDFSNLFARTLTVYNTTHWKDWKETRINTHMLKRLQEINLHKFHLGPDLVLENDQLMEQLRLVCFRTLFAIIFCRMKGDEALTEMFEQAVKIFTANFEKLPVSVLKACALFLRRDLLDIVSSLVPSEDIDMKADVLEPLVVDTFSCDEEVKLRLTHIQDLKQALEVLCTPGSILNLGVSHSDSAILIALLTYLPASPDLLL